MTLTSETKEINQYYHLIKHVEIRIAKSPFRSMAEGTFIIKTNLIYSLGANELENLALLAALTIR
ncbi:hypothetical protein Runsl_1154 [Runella slithyformis DSM 19594]|uniref:Uncharacterized protein n=1 Tax=Runella slithyformis (strain ATCC 29530 / DSM 19594 / LMG 11500 / NCIMB 11436 / LSU 4) TaxID=761193 RepID=A0A7U4E4M8_RUNSL|nr:hypothetical protein Runsl_1154 [Runella slithyformis DSM 19594]